MDCQETLRVGFSGPSAGWIYIHLAGSPREVGFQHGYQSDKPWWSKMKDPVKEIGDRILAATPNTEALIWVDFAVQDVFPPDASKGDRVPPKK